ncbi:hypothetical protein KVR01_001659 [Diaporthe batatas]|uniref:uncharacterized protein n=1 Tax=Diaporthe batatas TaxID=748121 RepID=UPI001D04A120|nr:uncharacterized protein KVR01_001659 [Diaporthe batatas]KAG8168910.1 hypothetical protein KVR01_001659 [Diaporthe batatas]
MPVLTSAGSDSDFSRLSGNLRGGLSVFPRSGPLLICTLTAAFAAAALYLLQKFVLPRFSPSRPARYISANSCPPRPPASHISSDSKPYLTTTCPGARQGQGHFGKQASWAISRGEAGATAQAGLGGPGPVHGGCPRSMEQDDSTAHPPTRGSRGVSNDSSYRPGQESSGLPRPGLPPFPAAAEESRHARASSSLLHHPPPLGGVGDELPPSTDQQEDSMDHYDDVVASHWAYGGFMTTARPAPPLFGHPYGVADDLGVTYYPDAGTSAPSVVGRGLSTLQPRPTTSTRRNTSSSHRRRKTSSDNRMPSPSAGYYPDQTPGFNMAGTSPSSEGSGEEAGPGSSHYSLSASSSRQRSVARNIPIPEGADAFSSTGPLGGYLDPSSIANTSFSPSSYPPASPLLPPPPLTDYPFDPAAVMFPGPGAVDGGVRVVYEDHDHEHDHSHEGNGPGEAAANPSAHTGGSSWTRHTRVYGGSGACLACAAAGGGGFYGARVRPEDKR